VRVTTAFNRVVALPGAWVASVSFTDAGIVLGLRRRGRWLWCPCGRRTRARYDSSRRRWRHLDFGACKVFLEADVYRIDCRDCGRVRTEQVPWARPGSRHSADFEDVVGWLAQRMDKTSVAKLMRCSWEAVDNIVARVVAAHIDDARLDALYRIGVDEISYRRGHKYLTIVANHDNGNVVWVGKDRTKESFEAFFTALGPARTAQVEAITLDASSIYLPVARQQAPQATLCLDPFHVIKWCNEALEHVFRQNTPDLPAPGGPAPSRRNWRRARYMLRVAAEKLKPDQHAFVLALRSHRYRLFRAWELKEQLRDLYRHVAPADAADYLKTWITRALRSRITGFRNLARRLRKHFDAIIASVHLGLSNSRLEGINAKIRVIQRRGYGHPDPDSLAAMIYLCLGGITITLPTQR
jgi:transposase